MAQVCKLRKDIPHPMTTLGAAVDLGKYSLVAASLGIEESVEVEAIGHLRVIADVARLTRSMAPM